MSTIDEAAAVDFDKPFCYLPKYLAPELRSAHGITNVFKSPDGKNPDADLPLYLRPGPATPPASTAEPDLDAETRRAMAASISELEQLRETVAQQNELLNSPHTVDWLRGVELEAAHQRQRFGTSTDVGKTDPDWFWLIGYLAGKALAASLLGDVEKAKHHTISTGAALLNWHRSMSGAGSEMRPGIDPVAHGIEPRETSS